MLGPQTLNTSRAYEITLGDESDNLLGQFTGSEPLTARIWAGGDQPTLATPTATWLVAADAHPTIKLTVTKAAIASLAALTYIVQIKANDGTDEIELYRDVIKFRAAPGSASVFASYIDAAELFEWAEWLEDLQMEGDYAGFARQLSQASDWLTDVLVDKFDRGQVTALSPADPGYASFVFGDAPSKWLRDQLAAGALMVRGKTKEIVAKKAIGFICASKIGSARDKTSYQQLAAQFAREANELVKSYRAELDTNADGSPDLVIDCGFSSVR